MAGKVTFDNQELPVQEVITILSEELRALQGNYSALNETLKQVGQKEIEKPQTSHNQEDMDLTLANLSPAPKPNFDLVSVLPSFSGDDKEIVSDFIDRINDVGKLSNWSESNKIVVAKLKLTGTALTFSKTDETCQTATTLRELGKALEARFKEQLPDHYYYEQLANVRQERGETIEQYADKVKRLGLKTVRSTQNPEVDQVLRSEGDRRAMEAFTRGLYGELGHQIRIRFPKTFQEAVTLAIAMWDVERRPSDDQRSRSEKHVFFLPTQTQKCFTCGQTGHKKANCNLNSNHLFNKPHFSYQNKPNVRFQTNLHAPNLSFTRPNVPSQYTPNVRFQTNVNTPNLFSNRQHFPNQNMANLRFQHNANRPKICNFCKKSGHFEVECRNKQRFLNSVPNQNFLQCQCCGLKGHTEQTCWKNPNNTSVSQQTNSNGGPKPAIGTSHQN